MLKEAFIESRKQQRRRGVKEKKATNEGEGGKSASMWNQTSRLRKLHPVWTGEERNQRSLGK